MEHKIDLETLIKSYDEQLNNTAQYNGWDLSDEGEKKRAIYVSLWKEWDEKNMVELGLKEYLGEDVFNDFMFCLNEGHDYGITFHALVDDTEEGCFLYNKEKTIYIISEWKKIIQFKKHSFYCGFNFKAKIKDFFYAGSFSKHKDKMNDEEVLELIREMTDSDEGFMPTLCNKIEELIGSGNSISDYYEFGQEDFTLYWHIRKETIPIFIDKFLNWIKYEELQDYFISYAILDSESDEFGEYDINKNKIEWTK